MTSRTIKQKRLAVPGLTLRDLADRGLISPDFHLQDPVDEKYRKLLEKLAKAKRTIDSN